MSFLADIPISFIVLCSGLGLVLIGLWGMLTQRNMIRMLHDKEAIFQAKRVLIVDDDMRNVFALSSVLEERQSTRLVHHVGDNVLGKPSVQF